VFIFAGFEGHFR